MGFLSLTYVNVGSFDKGEKIMGEHSFCIFFFLQQNTTGFINTCSWSSVQGACSVQVEALFHGGGEEALSHDLLRAILWQLQIVHTRVYGGVAGISRIHLWVELSTYD